MKDNILKNLDSYLTFELGSEIFAVNVANVLQILELPNITKVPKAPEYMKGVVNLHGSVLPVVDTRIKFGLPEMEYTANTCIIVLSIEIDDTQVNIGAIVDLVLKVLEVKEADIKPPPGIGEKYKSKFIQGMIKVNDEFIMLLDVAKVFSSDDLVYIKDSVNETNN